MSYTKLPAVKSNGPACLTCGCGAHDTLAMERVLAVGFGDVQVTRDGECVYSECDLGPDADYDSYWSGEDAERRAAEDPDHDWQIVFHAPLYDATYQRQGEGHWVLVAKGDGFA